MGEQGKRNQPCPCGSGVKYKNCHLGKPDPQVARKRMILPILIALAGIGAMVAIIATSDKTVPGIAVGLAGLVLAGIIAVFRDPPPPDTSGKDPGAINFGG
jgi:hypothetical protein